MEYSAGIFAMTATEQEAARAAAMREHEAAQSGNSALRLAIVTMSLAQSVEELQNALALTKVAERAGDRVDDPSFVSMLGLLVEDLLERERALEQERRERDMLQQQLDALRRLEQELNAQ